MQSGIANRGKKFSEEVIKRISEGHKGLKLRPHTEEEKRRISISSSKKFTPEYNAKFRKTMEQLGYWIPLEIKEDYAFYGILSNWIAKMFDTCVDTSQIELIKTHGVFHQYKNTKGVVRDHKLNRRTGFELQIFPEILRHPCNCNIITHANNVAKSFSSTIPKDSINIEDLFLTLLIMMVIG
jgi:hypothetical protein